MIIGACGFGSTGSSVVTDYLREYDNITVKDDLVYVGVQDRWIDRPREGGHESTYSFWGFHCCN